MVSIVLPAGRAHQHGEALAAFIKGQEGGPRRIGHGREAGSGGQLAGFGLERCGLAAPSRFDRRGRVGNGLHHSPPSLAQRSAVPLSGLPAGIAGRMRVRRAQKVLGSSRVMTSG
jgi:hypothetical protein